MLELPTTLTRLSFGVNGSSCPGDALPERLIALSALQQLSLIPWTGSTAKMMPLTALSALTQISLQTIAEPDPEHEPLDEPDVELSAGALAQEFAPVLQALRVCCTHVSVNQEAGSGVPRAASLCMTGVNALARLTMLTQLQLLGCSAVDGEHTGMAARDAQIREGIVWPVTPQQLATCLRQLPQLATVTLKSFRLRRQEATAAAAAAGASSTSGAGDGAPGIAVAAGADMLPVAEALAGLPCLTTLLCYNILLGAAAQGLRAASKLRELHLRECHVDDKGLGAMLQGFGSSGTLKTPDVSRQLGQGVTEEYQGHVFSRSPCLGEACLDAVVQHLPHLSLLTLTAQPLISLRACHAAIARAPALATIHASDPAYLPAMKNIYEREYVTPYKVFRGSRERHHAYGPVTGSDTESGDEEQLQQYQEDLAEAAAWADGDFGWPSDEGDYGPFGP
jgi:hypothetical protein